MAIYHCSANVISRSSGRSATGASAYRSGSEITDERTGLIHDYSNKKGVSYTEILTPDGAPAWASDRAKLWNAVEQAEKRKDAQLCREIEVAIPRELDTQQKRELVREFAQTQFVEKGMVADICIHHENDENPHAHILLTLRPFDGEQFGKKERSWNDKTQLQSWRSEWANHANLALERAGHKNRIDHRTLEEQGIERIPQIHIGPNVLQMEARGIQTDRGARALEIEQANEAISKLEKYREALEHERNFEIEAGAERRGIGSGNRTTGASLSDTLGRRETGDRGAAGIEPEADGKLDWRAEEYRRAMDESSREIPERSSGISERSGHRKTSIEGLDLAALGRSVSGFHHAYSGAADRILSLAASATRDTRGDHVPILSAERVTDRTENAVLQQIDAMGCPRYEIGVRDQKGRMLLRTWTPAELQKSLSWLKRENAKGADIFIRPAGDKNSGLILLDDLSRSRLEQMKHEGCAPAAIIETSPDNFQAWVRIAHNALEPDVATRVSQGLAKHYDADPNSADWRHFGRLAGFTNRKPEHQTDSGLNPWVLCQETSPNAIAHFGEKIIQAAVANLEQEKAGMEREKRIQTLQNASKSIRRSKPEWEYQKQFHALAERYGRDMDVSRADFMISVSMAKQGYSEKEIFMTLESSSPELPIRKAGHEQDYCARTVQAAFSDPKVKEFLDEPSKELEKTRSYPSLEM